MTKQPFNELPKDVQEKIKNTLKCFRKAYVTYQYGDYSVGAGIGVYARYAPDHKYIGTYTDTEIFTEKERILNYVNEFYSFPIQYKGERDYDLLRKAEKERLQFVFDENENLVLKEKQ